MTDIADKAGKVIEQQEREAVEAVVRRMKEQQARKARTDCAECGAELPEARVKMKARLCVDCQSELEIREGLKRGW